MPELVSSQVRDGRLIWRCSKPGRGGPGQAGEMLPAQLARTGWAHWVGRHQCGRHKLTACEPAGETVRGRRGVAAAERTGCISGESALKIPIGGLKIAASVAPESYDLDPLEHRKQPRMNWIRGFRVR